MKLSDEERAAQILRQFAQPGIEHAAMLALRYYARELPFIRQVNTSQWEALRRQGQNAVTLLEYKDALDQWFRKGEKSRKKENEPLPLRSAWDIPPVRPDLAHPVEVLLRAVEEASQSVNSLEQDNLASLLKDLPDKNVIEELLRVRQAQAFVTFVVMKIRTERAAESVARESAGGNGGK